MELENLTLEQFEKKHNLILDDQNNQYLNSKYKQYENTEDHQKYYIKSILGLSSQLADTLDDMLDYQKENKENLYEQIQDYNIYSQNGVNFDFHILVTEKQYNYRYKYEMDEKYLKENYKLTKYINEGRQGIIKQAIDLKNDDRVVAVKIIEADKDQRKFKYMCDEIRIMKNNNQSFLKYYDCFYLVDDNLNEKIYIVMELMEGDLRHFTRNQTWKHMKFFQNQYLNIFYQICLNLVQLKQHEIYHRDIKPDNVFYQINVQDIVIKIGDFSSIKIKKNDQFSCITAKVGSPFYMSPDYIGWDGEEENIDLEKSDVYSLGVTFVEILYAPNILEEKIFQKEEYEQQFEDFKRLVNNDELVNFLLQMVDNDYKKRPRLQDVMV